MTTYVIWVELNQARLFRIRREGNTVQVVHRHEMKHHTNSDPENHKDGEKFFHEVAARLGDADEILVMGPGLAKEHFRVHLERHHHQRLGTKIVGCLTRGSMRDAAILEESRMFFREYDFFHHTVSV